MMTRRKRNRTLEWSGIIALAVALHVLLFLSIKPDFFAPFKRSLTDGGSTSRPSMPHAIITIPIEIEDDMDPESLQPRATVSPRPPDASQPAIEEATIDESQHEATEGQVTIDIDDVIGRSPTTLPGSGPGSEGVVIPPRPLEITWPDTRKLKHCLGYFIDVDIRVSASGEILEVKPPTGPYPADCVKAALESARRIVFKPGQKEGAPATLWTQVRIEFRRKR